MNTLFVVWCSFVKGAEEEVEFSVRNRGLGKMDDQKRELLKKGRFADAFLM